MTGPDFLIATSADRSAVWPIEQILVILEARELGQPGSGMFKLGVR